ncbi:MAG TPA: cation diffusion facilitator family transporter [Opitutaceae bacterium]|nr:cation diffusion facilitator family transporter [Opitutaceae bacterium]HND61549.1 cation diffusion facilitator family transporter [Opitutaceae bacterium]
MTPPLAQHHAATQQRANDGAQLVLRGIGLNLLLAIAKFAGGIFGHTYALIADAAESLLDILSSLLVWTGFRVAGRPPDEDHPFGHGKAEALAGLGVAVFVFLMAGWLAVQAVHEILTPHQGPSWWTLVLLAAVITSKVIFSRKMGLAGARVGSTALGIEALHHWSDALTSGAAFVGISIALWGGKGWETADDWAALFACVIIAVNGYGMFARAIGDVMDTAAPANFEQEVRSLALTVPGVSALDKVRVRKSGLSHLVDIQVRVDGDLSVRAGHAIAHKVKDALLSSPPLAISDVSVHVEPALDRGAPTDGA